MGQIGDFGERGQLVWRQREHLAPLFDVHLFGKGRRRPILDHAEEAWAYSDLPRKCCVCQPAGFQQTGNQFSEGVERFARLERHFASIEAFAVKCAAEWVLSLKLTRPRKRGPAREGAGPGWIQSGPQCVKF